MKYEIHVNDEEVGNPRRGYHDTRSTVEFIYADKDHFLTSTRERELVGLLTHEHGFNMWWNITEQPSTERSAKHTWVVRHGFDSGD